jgi:hypothetical protein
MPTNPGVTVVDPQLVLGGDGLWRPAATSPAINGGAGSYSGLLSTDMDGQLRDAMFDIGADELSAAAILRRPLTPTDVGPSWLGGPSQFLAADFNQDRAVDADDLAMWRAGFGLASAAGLGDGDANADGAVDGADFLIWQQQRGGTISQAVMAVPEPQGVELIALGGCVASVAAVVRSSFCHPDVCRGVRADSSAVLGMARPQGANLS